MLEHKRKIVTSYDFQRQCESEIFYCGNVDEIEDVIKESERNSKNICIRASGQSLGDMILNDDNIILDVSKINKILNFDKVNGTILVEPGITFDELLPQILKEGWILQAIPGISKASIGGSISNNVHGKDSSKFGNFANNIIRMKILTSELQKIDVDQDHELFNSVISGIGLIGVIIEVELKLKKINTNFLEVKKIIFNNIDEMISKLDVIKSYDFSYAWIDTFSQNNTLGRGFFEVANWNKKSSYHIKKTDNTIKASNFIKKILVKTFITTLKVLPRRIMFRLMNLIYFNLNKFILKKNYVKSFYSYNFVHNKIPNFYDIFKKKGFAQLQIICDFNKIESFLRDILILSQKYRLESYLSGIKLHRKDNHLLSFSGNGVSVGIDLDLESGR